MVQAFASSPSSRITAWNQPIDDGRECCPAGQVETRDLARGVAGALFVSLPLLFTEEMWLTARDISDWVLLVFLLISLGLNRLYLEFSGFRHRQWSKSKWWDAVVAMGIGMFASALTLAVTGIIGPSLDFHLAVKLIGLETIPMSMGAAVAINQLGGGDGAEVDQTAFGIDAQVLLGSFLGGFLFAFNIAPTQETTLIVQGQNWWLVLATALISLGISYLTVAIAQFEQRDLSDRKFITSDWFEAVLAYLLAFVLSMILLWVFGYGTPLDPIEVWLPQTVALSYATALGGAGGEIDPVTDASTSRGAEREPSDKRGATGDDTAHPPTLLGWLVRIVSLLLLLLLIGTLVFEATRPEREVLFEAEPRFGELRRQNGQFLLPVEVTNRGTRTAHNVRLVVTDGGQERVVEIERMAQAETKTFVIAWDAPPRAVTARIESYEQP